jgi:hypothetical protein
MSTIRGSANYPGLLPFKLTDERPPNRPTILENERFANGQPSLRKRASRALYRFVIAFCGGVAATLAWQWYGDASREMIAKSYPQLGWLATQPVSTAQNAPGMFGLVAPAVPFDQQQLKASLEAMRQSIDRIVAGDELIMRSIDQIVTKVVADHEQMARNSGQTAAGITVGQGEMTRSIEQTAINVAASQKQIAGSIDQTATNSAQAPPARAPAAPPPPAVSYTQRRAWYSYVPSTRRNIHRNLLMGSDGTYKVVATDHNAAGNSNGGSICIFNAGGWSDCVSNAGDRYQLKPASIRWFVNIANGAAP